MTERDEEIAGLCERLRAHYAVHEQQKSCTLPIAQDIKEAATAITRLLARIAHLEIVCDAHTKGTEDYHELNGHNIRNADERAECIMAQMLDGALRDGIYRPQIKDYIAGHFREMFARLSEMEGQNVAMRGALQATLDYDEEVTARDEYQRGALSADARDVISEALASTGWPPWLVGLARFVGESSASMGAMEAYRAMPASLRHAAEQEGKDAAS